MYLKSKVLAVLSLLFVSLLREITDQVRDGVERMVATIDQNPHKVDVTSTVAERSDGRPVIRIVPQRFLCYKTINFSLNFNKYSSWER